MGAVVAMDTASEGKERVTLEARRTVEDAARERGVGLFYASPAEESVVLPDAV